MTSCTKKRTECLNLVTRLSTLRSQHDYCCIARIIGWKSVSPPGAGSSLPGRPTSPNCLRNPWEQPKVVALHSHVTPRSLVGHYTVGLQSAATFIPRLASDGEQLGGSIVITSFCRGKIRLTTERDALGSPCSFLGADPACRSQELETPFAVIRGHGAFGQTVIAEVDAGMCRGTRKPTLCEK